MGWTNFVILPEHKLAIEISRHVSRDDAEFAMETIEKIAGVDAEEVSNAMEKTLSKVTARDFSKMVECSEMLTSISSHLDHDDILLILWLLERKEDFSIIIETEFYENKEKYRDYRIIRIKY